MKKPSQRLQVVLKLGRLRERQAAEKLAERNRYAAMAQQQSEQLQSFQKEYEQQFSDLKNTHSPPWKLRNYQVFFRNLEGAVDTQSNQVELSTQQLQQARAEWQLQYARQNNMSDLIAKKHKSEQLVLEKRQQRELDDRRPYRTIE